MGITINVYKIYGKSQGTLGKFHKWNLSIKKIQAKRRRAKAKRRRKRKESKNVKIETIRKNEKAIRRKESIN